MGELQVKTPWVIQIEALQAALTAALERMESFALWADSQADAQSKGGHATFDIMELREQRDMTQAAIAQIEALKGPTP